MVRLPQRIIHKIRHSDRCHVRIKLDRDSSVILHLDLNMMLTGKQIAVFVIRSHIAFCIRCRRRDRRRGNIPVCSRIIVCTSTSCQTQCSKKHCHQNTTYLSHKNLTFLSTLKSLFFHSNFEKNYRASYHKLLILSILRKMPPFGKQFL